MSQKKFKSPIILDEDLKAGVPINSSDLNYLLQKVGIFDLVGMRLRRVAPRWIVFPLIKATKAGLTVKVKQLEAHYLAGGDVDNKIAQARAEERRAMAVALEQEMRAAVVQAEAEIPKAMAQALREGHIGVADYYKLQNILADTDMKKSIGTGADAFAESKKYDKSNAD